MSQSLDDPKNHKFLAEGPPGSSDADECQQCGAPKNMHNEDALSDIPDPRGDGVVVDTPTLENGQSNIINYMNDEPLLFGAGENSSHEYPGKIVINNESRYVDREVKHDQTGTGTAATGSESVGHDTTQPTLPTGAPHC